MTHKYKVGDKVLLKRAGKGEIWRIISYVIDDIPGDGGMEYLYGVTCTNGFRSGSCDVVRERDVIYLPQQNIP